MASLKDIRRRIGAVRNTQKVTRAMKLVAAAKLRRAQQAALDGRAYASALYDTAVRVSRRLGAQAPLLWRRSPELNCMDVIAIASDRGLCGGFNENLLRALEEGISDLASYGIGSKLFAIGKRGQRAVARKGYPMETPPPELSGDALIDWIVHRAVDRFLAGESTGCNLAFNRFVSAAQQKIVFWNLLPIHYRGGEGERHLEYLYEPTRSEALDALCQAHLRSSIGQALLESTAAEQAARMAAMDAATKTRTT